MSQRSDYDLLVQEDRAALLGAIEDFHQLRLDLFGPDPDRDGLFAMASWLNQIVNFVLPAE